MRYKWPSYPLMCWRWDACGHDKAQFKKEGGGSTCCYPIFTAYGCRTSTITVPNSYGVTFLPIPVAGNAQDRHIPVER